MVNKIKNAIKVGMFTSPLFLRLREAVPIQMRIMSISRASRLYVYTLPCPANGFFREYIHIPWPVMTKVSNVAITVESN